MLPLACVWLLALVQDPQPSIADRLNALIAKTNELSSFDARYKVHVEREGGEPTDGTIELAYSAPDRGAVRNHADKAPWELLQLSDQRYVLEYGDGAP